MTDLPPATRRGWLWLLLLAVGLGAAGWGYVASGRVVGPDTVSQVLVKTKPGLVGEASQTKAMFDLDTPDLYVRLTLRDGTDLRLPTQDDTPVGSGLYFDLDRPVALADVVEVAVWDDDPISDNVLDRVTPDVDDDSPRVIEGGRFRVVLRGRLAKPPTHALPLLLVGGVVATLAGAKLVWDQVV